MTAQHIDMTGALSVASIATGTGRAQRWTELEIFYLPGRYAGARGLPRPWVLETRGMSKVPGEETRTRRVAVGSLERLLRIVGQDHYNGRVLADFANDWAREHRAILDADRAQHGAAPLPMPATDTDALEWLYGQPDSAEGRAQPTYASMFADDFGVARRTVETALQKGTDIRVPLRAILPFIDRAAFRASREGKKA